MTREEEIRGLQRRFMFGGDLDRDAVQSLFDYIDYLLKQNQRLRGALEEIVEFDDVNANQIDGVLLQKIAHQALEGAE